MDLKSHVTKSSLYDPILLYHDTHYVVDFAPIKYHNHNRSKKKNGDETLKYKKVRVTQRNKSKKNGLAYICFIFVLKIS